MDVLYRDVSSNLFWLFAHDSTTPIVHLIIVHPPNTHYCYHSTQTTSQIMFQPSTQNTVGIVAIQFYIPKKAVSQSDLEGFDAVSKGKYVIGLGQSKMACVSDLEDINSMALTCVKRLLDDYSIAYTDIGRLEVGTETIIDKSKSVKSVLMQLFSEHGNTDIEGVDTTNACYGGTNALFNTVNWVESSSWDGRYGLVVAGDIAVYKSGSARPTGGAGVVAMLIGPNPVFAFEPGMRVTHMEHVWDFYKPDLHSEYPEVDGPLSNKCYIKAIDTCYNRLLNKMESKMRKSVFNDSGILVDDESTSETASTTSLTMTSDMTDARPITAPLTVQSAADYYCFHTPYCKLVQKSFGRMAYNDAKRHPKFYPTDLVDFTQLPIEESYTNKELEKSFMEFTKTDFESRVLPTLTVAKNVGNMYCASLYGGLVSLIAESEPESLVDKRIILFSYGSGLASSMFSLKCVRSPSQLRSTLNLSNRLHQQRVMIHPQEYDALMALREATHNKRDYVPVTPANEDNLEKGTFYLEKVDDKFRRAYRQF